MRTVSINTLLSKSINSLIDENMRFTIEEIEEDEEEEVKRVNDKIALLKEQYLFGDK